MKARKIYIFIILLCIVFVTYKPLHSIALENIKSENKDDRKQIVIRQDQRIKTFSEAYNFSSLCTFTEEMFSTLMNYQSNQFAQAEDELRDLIKRYPMCGEPRAGLTAILWRKGLIGEATSNWAAAEGLESNFDDSQWIIISKEWPQRPAEDLANFLEFIK